MVEGPAVASFAPLTAREPEQLADNPAALGSVEAGSMDISTALASSNSTMIKVPEAPESLEEMRVGEE